MKEIHIIGGGLAGLSLGIFLRKRDIPVRLTEAANYPRHRVCGEFISGIEERQLKELGIDDQFGDAKLCYATAWYDEKGKFLQADLPHPAIGISRHLLDSRLAESFQQLGGQLESGTRAKVENEASEDRLQIVATGRARQKEGGWLGLKCHLSGFELESDLEMHMSDGGYLGLSSIEYGKVNACGLFKLNKELKVSRESAMEVYLESCGLGSLLKRIQRSDRDDDSCIAVNAFEFGVQPSPDSSRQFCIGDRFSVIGPFTGHGMTLALESSLISGKWIEKYAAGLLNRDQTISGASREMRETFRRRLLMSSALHPFLTTRTGRKFFAGMARSGFLPFRALLRMLR